jgi:hypothetical protein
MDFFADDKFASTSQKNVTTRKTVVVRPASRPATSRLPSTDHASSPLPSWIKSSGSRGGTPVESPNKRRRVTEEKPARKKAQKVTKATITKRPVSSATSSSSEEDERIPQTRAMSNTPAEEVIQPPLQESSPVTRQVFRPKLIHSEILKQRPAGTTTGWKGYIPSTSIVAFHLSKYRSCKLIKCSLGRVLNLQRLLRLFAGRFRN